jgi:hypothetical protein
MKYIALTSLVLGSSLLGFACSRTDSVSETKEGLDTNSSFSLLGNVTSPKYDDLIKTKVVETERQPWTDSYWPLTEKGLSRRWNKSDKPIGLSEFFATQTEQNKAKSLDPYLSPAEKYDILFRWRHSSALNETANAELIKSWDLLDNNLDLNAEVSSSRALVKGTSDQFGSASLADFRKQFPMSSDGWASYLYYNSTPHYQFLDKEGSGEDWSWMGSCHGWAPAALMAETPKHAVLAKFEDREVLVTEGDIRGLLTKAWADHSPSQEQFFVGRRCNKNIEDPEGEIPADEQGRGYYGEITRGDAKMPFFVNAEQYTSFARASDRIYPISFKEGTGVDKYLLQTYMGNNRYSNVLSDSLDSIRNFIVYKDRTNIEDLGSNVEMFGCWDVNPATLHLALLEKVGKDKLGLVMDRTRTAQVWNQPVFKATFDVGNLIAVSETKGGSRAVNTKWVAKVSTDVSWISEPAEQRMHYSTAFENQHVMTSNYVYVLEFDRSMNLIGGSWGDLVDSGEKNAKGAVIWKQEHNKAQVTPDFLYGFTKGSLPVDNVANGFDYSGIIGKLHACSLSATTDGKIKVGTQNLTYAKCDLSKVTP